MAPAPRSPARFPGPGTVVLAGGMAAVGLAILAVDGGGAVQAAPQLDLKPYPAPAPTERRWVIQLPAPLPTSPDPALSSHPADVRVQLIVGRTLDLDCNRVSFSGRLRGQPVAGGDLRLIRVTDVTPLASTRMACPPEQPRRRAFVPMAGKPFVLPYDSTRPIVLYAPKDLELRWRLWRAERRQWPAQER